MHEKSLVCVCALRLILKGGWSAVARGANVRALAIVLSLIERHASVLRARARACTKPRCPPRPSCLFYLNVFYVVLVHCDKTRVCVMMLLKGLFTRFSCLHNVDDV